MCLARPGPRGKIIHTRQLAFLQKIIIYNLYGKTYNTLIITKNCQTPPFRNHSFFFQNLPLPLEKSWIRSYKATHSWTTLIILLTGPFRWTDTLSKVIFWKRRHKTLCYTKWNLYPHNRLKLLGVILNGSNRANQCQENCMKSVTFLWKYNKTLVKTQPFNELSLQIFSCIPI